MPPKPTYTTFQTLPFRVRHSPRLIITGAPASGKGTQCELLVRVLHVVHVSTGSLLRDAIEKNTKLGQQAQGYMARGHLVPDVLLVNVVFERLGEPDFVARGSLLDGFSRTLAQAQALVAAQIVPDCVLALHVPDEQVIKRIAGQRLDPETGKTYHVDFNPPPLEIADRLIQRRDDTEATVHTRLEQFHTHSHAVVSLLGGVCPLNQVIERVASRRWPTSSWVPPSAAFSATMRHVCRFVGCAWVFLVHVLEEHLPASGTKPARVNYIRYVYGDASVSTNGEEDKFAGIFFLLRRALPFLATFTLTCSANKESEVSVLWIAKGDVRFGTTKCAQMLGRRGRNEKSQHRKAGVFRRLRAPTSKVKNSDLDEREDCTRKTISSKPKHEG
ncbi:hypothetical protein PsorP6_006954 [Peronosclerospora sorghi]|uniref:Uncharacterized protein n=1 Tax=Peronosclerospora sorghi TaxID=230839 RepID=A0ACC0WAJ4_9STRA|nr:hypothetical protein PsorP6_006954 [Peronosclerospora sorghi]